ncbi:MAG: branched-chain amino acid ABC transporter ATP-binding protein/permease [Burkholderiales bacterium]|nr:branched-chain amino acid ABC transporter ATP-binding protein/permease [Burkholderiales bacterium]
MSARLLAAIVILAAASITACFFSDGYQVFVIANVALTAIVAIGLNVLLGLAGQISLGHVGFYAIGAYTCGILTTRHEWDFWAAFPIAGLLAALAGALLAMPALRVRGPYLAMVTIAFGFVVEQSAAELRDFTGGWNGLMGIPRPALGGFAFEEISLAVFAIALAAVLLILFARLRDSTWGLAMRATRDAEVASQAIGLNLVAVRTVAFTLSAFLAGLAGALFASLNQFISPESFPFFQSITFLLVVLVGGAGTVLSPVVGSMIVVLLPEMLAFLAEYRLLFFGSLLLVVLWLAPEGIMGKLEPWLAPRRGAAEPASEAEVEAFLRRDDPVPLSTHDLSIAFGGTRAVDGVRLTAGPGAVTSIIGPNGAGKTTLLNLISGFYKPDRGRAQLGATPLPRGSTHLVARAGVARTFQTTQLFPRMTVLENLLIAMRLGRLGGLHRALAGPDDEARARLAAGLLRFVGYAGPVECPAAALAHVDRRLVEVARALALGPRVVTLDEPAAGLNDADTARLGELLRRMGSLGIAVVIIEHDMNLVMGFSDRVTVLDAGRMIAEGDPAAVRADPGCAPRTWAKASCVSSAARGLRKRRRRCWKWRISLPATARCRCWRASDCASVAASWWRCSAPTARARPR